MHYNKDFFEAMALDLELQIAKNNEELTMYPTGTLRHDYYFNGRERNRIFLASKQENGKITRKSINNHPDLLLKALRREYLSAQNNVLTRDMKLLQALASEFTDTLPISYIEEMPKRFHTLPASLVRLFATAEPSAILTGEQTVVDSQTLCKLAMSWIPKKSMKKSPAENAVDGESKAELKENSEAESNGSLKEISTKVDAHVNIKEDTQNANQNDPHLDFFIEDEFDAWEYAEYEKSTYMPEHLTQPTNKGENVRSKSESLIANKLFELAVPYRYEQVLHIGLEEFAPDFTVRCRRTGKTFYWEHFGLISNKKYMDKHWWKLQLYASVGIKPWDNLIVTYDDVNGSLNLPFVEAIIKSRLM